MVRRTHRRYWETRSVGKGPLPSSSSDVMGADAQLLPRVSCRKRDPFEGTSEASSCRRLLFGSGVTSRGTEAASPRPAGRGRSSSAVREPSPCVSCAERDAFDTLFDHAPDKLSLVKKVSTWAAVRVLGFCSPGSTLGEGGKTSEVPEMSVTWIGV